MAMNQPTWIFLGAVLPGIGAGLILLLACLPFRSPSLWRVRLGWLLPICLAPMVGFAAERGWPTDLLATSEVRLFVILMPIVFVAALLAMLKRHVLPQLALIAIAAGAMLPVLVHKTIFVYDFDGAVEPRWDTTQKVLWMSIVPIVVTAVAFAGQQLVQRKPSKLYPWIWGISLFATSLSVAFNGSEFIAQIAMTCAAATLGVALIGTFMPQVTAASFAAAPTTLVIASLVSMGHLFGELNKFAATALLIAPLLALLNALPWMQRRKPWQRSVIVLLAVIIPLIVMVGYFGYRFAQEYEEPYSY